MLTGDTAKRLTVMTAPNADRDVRDAAVALLAKIKDSAGFIAPRMCAMIASLGGEMAMIGIASTQDVDTVMTLGLDYPRGPLVLELEGGVYRDPAYREIRRVRLDTILAAVPTLAFDDAAADAYGVIVASAGYSRRKLLDRMVAAQALVHRASLVTMNAGDYADVPGLALRAW